MAKTLTKAQVEHAQQQLAQGIRSDLFNGQKPVPKELLYRCKPFTVLELKFLDAPNCLGMLYQRVERGAGEQDVKVLCADGTLPYAGSGQVVRIGDVMQIPKL